MGEQRAAAGEPLTPFWGEPLEKTNGYFRNFPFSFSFLFLTTAA